MRPGLPLHGIGLFHKGHKGFGGFLALKVIGLNVSDYLQTEIPADMRKQYEVYYNQPLLSLTPQIEGENATST